MYHQIMIYLYISLANQYVPLTTYYVAHNQINRSISDWTCFQAKQTEISKTGVVSIAALFSNELELLLTLHMQITHKKKTKTCAFTYSNKYPITCGKL